MKGVIANESPPSWPQAALRAQAVAARSFALSVNVGGNGFDLYNDTRSQVYGGLDSETASTNAAADATRGQVVIYGGKIAETYFSACSGGHTESVQNVFFGPSIPYLVGVPDPYDYYCPLHDWTLRFSGPEISAKLGGYLDGALKKVVVTQRGVSPRIVWAKLYGTGGVTKVRGDQLEAALGTYSDWMSFVKLVNGKAVGGGETRRRKAGERSRRRSRSGLGQDQLRVDGAVIAAGQIVDAVFGDPEAAVGEDVVDRDRAAAAGGGPWSGRSARGPCRRRRRRRGSRARRRRATRPGRGSR